MKYFLMSTLLNYEDRKIIQENNFIYNLKKSLDNKIDFLFVASMFSNFELNDKYFFEVKNALEIEGIKLSTFKILDNRTKEKAKELIYNSNLIFLAGGHVPSQNKSFKEINLKELLKDYNKVLISSSAGSMNSADIVYAIPEIEGEAKNKNYKRFLTGLGITKIKMIPHFQYIKTQNVDGLNMIYDIAINDSFGEKFYGLEDGSYIMGEKNKFEKIIGKLFLIENGEIKFVE